MPDNLFRGHVKEAFFLAFPHFPKIAEVERELIEQALAHTKGHVNKTAEMTGFSRATLYRKCNLYGIVVKDYRVY